MTTTIREKSFLIIFACALVILYLMSSTDLIIKEEQSRVYNVSVIIEDSKDDYYVNYKKGMEQAAIDYNIDVSFITLYERNNKRQQEDMLVREVNDGAEAIVLSPVEPMKMAALLEERSSQVPIIVLNDELSVGKAQSNITVDYFEAGRQLAGGVCRDISVNVPVYLFTEGLEYGSNARFYDGIVSVLQESSYRITLVEKTADFGYQGILKNLCAATEKQVSVVALDCESLMEIAMQIQEQGADNISLYGPGATLQILAYMDKGIIKGISTTNWYDGGYLSMMRAVEAIQNRAIRENVKLDHFYLQKDDIHQPKYEKLLYPIN